MKFDLTGVWNGDDSGKYYVRQIGNNVSWFGEQNPTNPAWSNVAHGYIIGNVLILEWADVPKGTSLLNGTLLINIVSPTKMSITTKTGNFGGNSFQKV